MFGTLYSPECHQLMIVHAKRTTTMLSHKSLVSQYSHLVWQTPTHPQSIPSKNIPPLIADSPRLCTHPPKSLLSPDRASKRLFKNISSSDFATPHPQRATVLHRRRRYPSLKLTKKASLFVIRHEPRLSIAGAAYPPSLKRNEPAVQLWSGSDNRGADLRRGGGESEAFTAASESGRAPCCGGHSAT